MNIHKSIMELSNNREWGYGQLNLYNTFEVMRQL